MNLFFICFIFKKHFQFWYRFWSFLFSSFSSLQWQSTPRSLTIDSVTPRLHCCPRSTPIGEHRIAAWIASWHRNHLNKSNIDIERGALYGFTMLYYALFTLFSFLNSDFALEHFHCRNLWPRKNYSRSIPRIGYFSLFTPHWVTPGKSMFDDVFDVHGVNNCMQHVDPLRHRTWHLLQRELVSVSAAARVPDLGKSTTSYRFVNRPIPESNGKVQRSMEILWIHLIWCKQSRDSSEIVSKQPTIHLAHLAQPVIQV